MKKIFLLTLTVPFVIFSCNKNEQINKIANKQEQFTEPLTQAEINAKVKSFINILNQSERSLLLESTNYSIPEAIWTIEACLNYSFDELDKNINHEQYVKDSFLLDGISTTIPAEICESIYLQFSNSIQRIKDEDSTNVIRLIDIDISNNYLTMEFIYGQFEEGTRGISDPNFLPGESYYAYDLINYVWTSGNPSPQPPGPDNAAIYIQSKLRLRYNILYLPVGSYWTSVTLWQPQTNGSGVGITTDYYGQFCTAPTLKLWGSPGLEACYKGITESNMLGYTYLNFLLNEADNRISYLPYPPGKQVSHIEYWVGHWVTLQNDQNTTPCLGQWEYSSKFRWRYGILVTER